MVKNNQNLWGILSCFKLRFLIFGNDQYGGNSTLLIPKSSEFGEKHVRSFNIIRFAVSLDNNSDQGILLVTVGIWAIEFRRSRCVYCALSKDKIPIIVCLFVREMRMYVRWRLTKPKEAGNWFAIFIKFYAPQINITATIFFWLQYIWN